MHALETIARAYLQNLQAQKRQANTTDELSYRDFLSTFLRDAAKCLNRNADFTAEPRKITYGRPDYEVTKGLKVIGYIEAEALGASLSTLKGHAKEQNQRFRENLYNFLLTNHTEFRLYRDGKEILVARLPEPPDQGIITLSQAALDELQSLLETFLDAATPAAATPEAIARQLARRARFLRVAADAMLSHDDSPLHPYLNLYRQTLFDGIDTEKFADVYAQTFTYGLFLAWLNTSSSEFNREIALHSLPTAVPPIRTLMQFSDLGSLPEEFHWIVDGICSDLESADRAAAMKHGAGIADPLVHFYETFLAAYDPQLRERAGVYYTPDPVVDFIVRAVDDLLRRNFGKPEGLADESVRLLDPATGTATFLARAYRQTHETMMQGGDAGLWPDRARTHLATHFYAFERLPAAYTLAHIKLRQMLADLGAPLSDSQRLPVYLADTMMNKAPEAINLPGADILSREIREASAVRDREPVLVVLGNPPYFGKSDNPSKDAQGNPTFIGDLIQDYYRVDGVPLGEKNPKWLQNDYVKFIRFAQWKIERNGSGIVAFITDNSYLDNPTFRGMRRSLMQTFDEIYLLDLHGNSKKKERAPDDTKDENVFDITQGVAIALFIKYAQGSASSKQVVIRHADLYGTRAHKYNTLLSSDLQSVGWQELAPNAPFYLFRPQEQELREEYEQGWSITEVFPVNVLGFQTHRDQFAIDFEESELHARIADFYNRSLSDDDLRSRFALGAWDVGKARNKLRAENNWQAALTKCHYRPFDVRYYFAHHSVVDRVRPELIRSMVNQENLALNIPRQTKAETWQHALVSNLPTPALFVEIKDGSSVFPLWLYPENGTLAEGEGRRPNLSPAFVKALTERVGETPTPEAIFHYAYAVFHAPTYRERYAPFLKIDFPRLPLPADAATFHTLAALGEKLVALHLLEAPELAQHGIVFPVSGDHIVKKMRLAERYLPPTSDGQPGRVRLNDTEYFDNVPPEAWAFRVGGYQPAFKWLDDRAGRALTPADITHYRRLIAAMRETVALLPAVDSAFRALLLLAPEAE